MSRRFTALGLVAALGFTAGCSQDEGHEPAPPAPVITIAASATSVLANGVNSVTLTVTDTQGGPITATTNRGTFAGGGQSATIGGGSGALTLVTCDAAAAGCAGTAVVVATGPSGTTQQSIAFGTLAAICATNCAADPDCANRACAAGGLQGTCSSTVPLRCVTAQACVATGPTETICSDGVDQDCDGRVDCNDPDCQARGGNLGQVCDALRSLTCSAPDAGGNGTCSYCPGQQAQETTCNDQTDNDCDGEVDCEDAACTDVACGIAGRTCDGGTKLCSCPTGLTAETTCGDGADDDCDGAVDCEDTDCQIAGGQSCGAFGLVCTGEGACACPGTREVCTASGDEDCDGLTECADPDCQPLGNAFGAICAPTGHTCSSPHLAGGSTCSVCPGGQQGTGELSCFDGKDNDCDGRLDCQDDSCTGRTCSATGHTCDASLLCSCAGGQVAETTCGNGQDDDCDGKTDCADSDCSGRTCGTNGLACTGGVSGTCACSGNGGRPEATETSCGDGFDNDCDGFSDCGDTACQPVGNALGAVCNAGGMTCSVNLGAGSSCSVCSGNGGRPEATEASCGDGFDNDCDGVADCQDPDCATLACSATGKTCAAATKICACSKPEAGGEITCDNGSDDDCDGKIDCADEDCAGDVCGASGLACAGATCACSGNGGVVESAEASCGDGHDNDCDGAPDCADAGCRPAAGQTYGVACDTGGSSGMRCNAASTCVCSGNGGAPEATETSCGDGFDNDCDGRLDCADADCQPSAGPPAVAGKSCDTFGNTCSAAGTCSVCSGNGGLAEALETSCGDSRDNDCDGKADCADDHCASQACNPSNPALRCLAAGEPPVSTCTDVASLYSVTLAATRTRIPADGLSTSDVTATFKKNGVAIPNATCTFGPAARFAAPLAIRTSAAGQAAHRFTSDASGGTATVTVSCTDGLATVDSSLAIDQPRLGAIAVQHRQFSVLGARASGFQERSLVTFQVADAAGQPYPAGLAVSFTHASQGGSFLGEAPSCTPTPPFPSTCSASGVTDDEGKVQVLVHSGRTFAQLSVRAQASAGAVSAAAVAGGMAVVGAKPSGARISLDCTPHNVPALTRHDCTNSYLDRNITCTASFADRHGIVLGVPAVVEFKSEAGR